MRIVVLILLLANVALLAYLDYDAQRAREGARLLTQQVKQERIRIMTAQEVAALRPGATACLEIGPLAAADLARAREAFGALQPAPKVSERKEGEVTYLQLREVPAAVRQRVDEIGAAFGGAELKVCPAPAG